MRTDQLRGTRAVSTVSLRRHTQTAAGALDLRVCQSTIPSRCGPHSIAPTRDFVVPLLADSPRGTSTTTGCSPGPSAVPSKCRGCCAGEGGSPASALLLSPPSPGLWGRLRSTRSSGALKVVVTREAEGSQGPASLCTARPQQDTFASSCPGKSMHGCKLRSEETERAKEPKFREQIAQTLSAAPMLAMWPLMPRSWTTQSCALSPDEMQEIKRLETTITTCILSAPAPAVFSNFAKDLWDPT